MKEKYKVLLKCGTVALGVGVVMAALVYIGWTVYLNGFTLDYIQVSLSNDIRIAFTIIAGILPMLATMTIQLGIIERKAEKIWREENRKMAKDFNSDIKGVNLAGLIDDTQGKEFCDMYGGRVKVGEDHGTAYMIFKTLSIFVLFVAVFTSMPMLFMMLSLR